MKKSILILFLMLCNYVSFYAFAKVKSFSDPVISVTNGAQTIEVNNAVAGTVLSNEITLNLTSTKAAKTDTKVNLIIFSSDNNIDTRFLESKRNDITITFPKGIISFNAHIVISYRAANIDGQFTAYISQKDMPETAMSLTFLNKGIKLAKSLNNITLMPGIQNVTIPKTLSDGKFLTTTLNIILNCTKTLANDTAVTIFMDGNGAGIKPLFVAGQLPGDNKLVIKLSKGQMKYTVPVTINYNTPDKSSTYPILTFITTTNPTDNIVTLNFNKEAITSPTPPNTSGKPVPAVKPAPISVDITLTKTVQSIPISKSNGSDAYSSQKISLEFNCNAVLAKDTTLNLIIQGDGADIKPEFVIAAQDLTAAHTLPIKLSAGKETYTTQIQITYNLPSAALTDAVSAYIGIANHHDDLVTLKFTNKTDVAAPAAPNIANPVTTVTPVTATKANAVTDPGLTLTNGKLQIPVTTKLATDPYFLQEVKLEFTGTSKLKADATITLQMMGDAGDIKPAFSIKPPATASTIDITLSKDDVTQPDVSKEVYVYKKSVYVNYQSPAKILTAQPVIYIYVKDKGSNSITVTFINKVEVTRSNNYWMEVGANFDLLDGVSATNLYAGVMAFEKDITKVKLLKHKLDVSFTGGVYESKSSTFSNSSDSGLVYRDGRSYIKSSPKGYPYFRDTGSYSITTTVQSIGLFFSPHFKLSDLPTTSNGVHVYLSIYAEMLWQRVKSTYDYSKTKTDTVMYTANMGDIYQYNYKESAVNMDFRSHYFGAGIPVYLVHDDYTFYINPVLGATNQRFAILDGISAYKNGYTTNTYDNGFFTPKNTWNMFYITQFRLTSEEYGITFTGEVRGLFLKQSKPIVSLALSKKLDLGKFFGGILSK